MTHEHNDAMKITGCSMGCLYATGPIDKCLCKCGGKMHSLMVPHLQPANCTPAARIRCQNGMEGTECHCACRGINHGLYKGIEDYSKIKITAFAQ